MTTWMRMAALAAVLSVPACGWFGGGNKSDKPEAVDAESLKKAVQVAKAIRKEPSKADAALKEAGISRAELEDLMYKIAADEDAAAKYAKALKEGK